MNPSKKLTGPCQHCGMPLEFLADSIGLAAKCPYCRKDTELMLAPPEPERSIPTRAIVWTIVAVTILVLGLLGAFAALRKAQDWAGERKAPPAVNK